MTKRAAPAEWARVGKGLAVALAGLVVLLLLITKIIHTAWNHERAGRTISRLASSSLAGEGGATKQAFTFGRVDYPWLGAVWSLVGGRPVRVEVSDVHIWDPEGKEVLFAAHLETGLRLNRLVGAQLWSALPGAKPDLELYFVDVKVDQVRCQIAPDKSGQVNLVAAFSSRRPSAPQGGGMVISVERSTVHDGRFQMRFPGWQGALEHFSMSSDSLRYSSFPKEQSADAPAFTFRVSTLEAPTGALSIGDYDFPLERFVATKLLAEAPRQEDIVLAGSAHSRGALVKFAGRLTDLYKGASGVELHLDARHGRATLASLPTQGLLGGDVSATAYVHGPFTAVTLEGDTHGAELNEGTIHVHDIAAQYRLANRTLRLDEVTSDVAGGHVSGNATVDFRARSWRADLTLTEVHSFQVGVPAPLVILALLAGVPHVVLHAGMGDTDASETLTIHGVELTLYRRPRDLIPHRVSLHGSFAR